MFDNIPSELRSLRQWCLWRYEHVQGSEKPTKVPYQPNGRHANVNDSSSYSSFDECISRLGDDNRYSGLGFIFTSSDPYAGIDLDNPNGDQAKIIRYQKVYDTFISYAELSISGTGVHIIVKGSVPTGVRQQGIEVYSSQRFFVFTGNIIRNEPIKDYSETLLQLWSALDGERKSSAIAIVNEPETKTDDEILALARGAENGDKFAQLYDQKLEGDDSAFDMALCNFLVFHSRNNAQVERLFRASVRGKRDKIKRKDYLPRTITRARDKMQNVLAPIDIEGFQEAIKQKLASVAQLVEPVPHKNFDLGSNPSTSTNPEIPPGLIGRLTHYIYQSSARPVWEIALAGAIATMAGICGKAYTCRGTTLNLYVLVVADTGVGKEAPKDAISALFRAIDAPLITPIAAQFRGPGQISSGQALMNYIKDSPSFVCMLGEFGIRIQTICDPRASSAEKTLYAALLDLFGVGKGVIAEGIYSDKTKSSKAVDGHAISIIGDTTPETFYSMIDESLIASGLLPRFIIMEYNGKRQYFNEDKLEAPPIDLVRDVGSLIAVALSKIGQKISSDVIINDDAKQALRDIDRHTTDMMNDTSKGMNKALWNRAHLKIQRLAALCAIGINPYVPTLDYACVHWAAKIVYHDIELLLKKFEGGAIGKNSDIRQQNEVMAIMMNFITKSWNDLKKYDCGSEDMHRMKIVPYKYINKRLSCHSQFKSDRSGESTKLITATLKTLCEMGTITEIPSQQMFDKFKTRQKAYGIN